MLTQQRISGWDDIKMQKYQILEIGDGIPVTLCSKWIRAARFYGPVSANILQIDSSWNNSFIEYAANFENDDLKVV